MTVDILKTSTLVLNDEGLNTIQYKRPFSFSRPQSEKMKKVRPLLLCNVYPIIY